MLHLSSKLTHNKKKWLLFSAEQSTLGIWPLSCKINYSLQKSIVKPANIKINHQCLRHMPAQSSVLQKWLKLLSILTKAMSHRHVKNVRSSYHVTDISCILKENGREKRT